MAFMILNSSFLPGRLGLKLEECDQDAGRVIEDEGSGRAINWIFARKKG